MPRPHRGLRPPIRSTRRSVCFSQEQGLRSCPKRPDEIEATAAVGERFGQLTTDEFFTVRSQHCASCAGAAFARLDTFSSRGIVAALTQGTGVSNIPFFLTMHLCETAHSVVQQMAHLFASQCLLSFEATDDRSAVGLIGDMDDAESVERKFRSARRHATPTAGRSVEFDPSGALGPKIAKGSRLLLFRLDYLADGSNNVLDAVTRD